MFIVRSGAKCGRLVVVAAVAGVLAGIQTPTGWVQADESKALESNSVATENDSVSLEAHHHYQSSAERANDALLITEVKTALAEDGVAEDSPIVVACDHGKILLSGVMKSAEDARHAGDIASKAPGVVGVKNLLTWH
jgi:osmotically-inducible protein OsmY